MGPLAAAAAGAGVGAGWAVTGTCSWGAAIVARCAVSGYHEEEAKECTGEEEKNGRWFSDIDWRQGTMGVKLVRTGAPNHLYIHTAHAERRRLKTLDEITKSKFHTPSLFSPPRHRASNRAVPVVWRASSQHQIQPQWQPSRGAKPTAMAKENGLSRRQTPPRKCRPAI
jgi:hypothetical protein